jgi:hypothetical protein
MKIEYMEEEDFFEERILAQKNIKASLGFQSWK